MQSTLETLNIVGQNKQPRYKDNQSQGQKYVKLKQGILKSNRNLNGNTQSQDAHM